jgi:hypothetical protein
MAATWLVDIVSITPGAIYPVMQRGNSGDMFFRRRPPLFLSLAAEGQWKI